MGEEIASTFLDGFRRFGIECALERSDFVACCVKCIEDLVCIRNKIAMVEIEPVMVVDIAYTSS